MSKTITINETYTGNPSSYDTSNYSYASVSNLTRFYADTSSTNYGQVNLKTGRSAETYIYFKFDTSSIPAEAVINSVSCSVKALINNTSSSRINSRQVQLCTGTTLKGTAYTNVSTSATTFTVNGGTSWTRNEVSNIGIRFYAKRGTSGTTSSYYYRLYGAVLTIEYSYNETVYVLTITNETNNFTISPSGEIECEEGQSQTFTISGGDFNKLSIYDNNTDIKTSLTSSGNSWIYTLNNISDDHTIRLIEELLSLYVKENNI